MGLISMKDPRYLVNRWFDVLFSDRVKSRVEKTIITVSIVGFFTHLLLIWLHGLGIFSTYPLLKDLLEDPITAIYTPFSFILVFEVYLLVFYLPQSITSYIGKQYEIVSLIVIRRIFKDISKLNLSDNWFAFDYNRQLLFDAFGIIILFLLTFVFYRLSTQKYNLSKSKELSSFISAKKLTSLLLLPTLVVMALFSLFNWLFHLNAGSTEQVSLLHDMNDIFYHDFFNVLILVDVLMLLISLRFTNYYGQLMRNAGFIISTILIKLSFSTSGLLNILMIIGAISFGVLILWIYNHFVQLKMNSQQIS
jgi:hypothetical protein